MASQYCIKNTTTHRCNKSVRKDATSGDCVLFRRTNRCRTVKIHKHVIDWYGFKLTKPVQVFLTKEILNTSSDSLCNDTPGLASLLNDFPGDTLYKRYLVKDVLMQGQHVVLDNDEGTVITLSHIKRAMQTDYELAMVTCYFKFMKTYKPRKKKR